MTTSRKKSYPFIFSIITVIILIISYIFCVDTFTWFLEVFPIIIALPILFFTYNTFPLTRLLYILLIVHFIILAIGGIYTYAKVPLGFWIQDLFNQSRNNYDKIGHFAQGFIPALLTRELLLRTSPLKQSKWLAFIIVSICLAISAMYEIIEWWTAELQGATAEAFLGTQGYEWDAQSDMFTALCGIIVALITLSKIHNKQLNTLYYKHQK
ncbi:MAG TPA: DUF2238 domain-containing protein [Bacteroidales bacterium]|nr:DUF2238 domain-containing protein [Bacteroidales bacterium]